MHYADGGSAGGDREAEGYLADFDGLAGDEMLLRAEIEGKCRLYEALAESVPRGEVRLVDAGHITMHLRHPDAVIQAIGDLLGR